jgi:hypothetical protein
MFAEMSSGEFIVNPAAISKIRRPFRGDKLVRGRGLVPGGEGGPDPDIAFGCQAYWDGQRHIFQLPKAVRQPFTLVGGRVDLQMLGARPVF